MLEKHRKKIIIAAGVAGACVLAFLLFIGISYYNKLKTPGSPVLSAVPHTAGVIIEINSAKALWDKVSANTDYWADLSQIPPFYTLNEQLVYVDSIIKISSDAVSIIESNPLVISMHPAAQKPVNFLFLTGIKGRKSLTMIEGIYKDIYKQNVSFTKSKFKDVDLLEVKPSDVSLSLFFTLHKGVLICSSVRTLVEDAVLQLNSETSFSNSTAFLQVAQTVGKKVDANIFVNYKQFQRIFIEYVSEDFKQSLAFLPDFGLWSGLDVNVKNDGFVLNGFTNPSENEVGFLNLMANQPAPKIEIVRLLPHNTSSFIFLGFDNFKLYYNSHLKQKEKQNKLSAFKAEMLSFEKMYNVNVENDFADHISSEVAYATLVDNMSGSEPLNFLLIRFKDKEKLNEICSILTAQTKAKTGSLPDTTSYRDYVFGYFDYPDIFNNILGTEFNLTELKMMSVVENYLVLGHSKNALIHIINALVFNRNLNNNVSYNSFSNLLSAKSNVYIYINIANSKDLIKNYVSKEIAENIEQYKDNLVRFESIALQISESKGLFYNNLCVFYNPKQIAEESYSLWETEIEKPAAGKIFKVKNHNDDSNEILISDESKNVYLIDRNGMIQWKLSIGEDILSDFHQIDFYNNGKLQYLFNTSNFIYLIDRNGKNVANFPVKLKHKATNGVSVFDYDNNKNYRLFLATEKNEIINLDKNAEKVSGWNIYKTQNTVNSSVQFIRLLGKDFIVLSDINGKVYILDRRGDVRVKPDKPFEKSTRNIFYQYITTDNKGRFVTTDKKGKIITIDFNGKTEETSFSDFSENHFFVFEDINNNSIKDYIFIDEKRLMIYDLNKTLLKEYTLDGIVEHPPVFFNDAGKNKLGILTNNGKIYLLNNEMEIAQGFPLDATVMFVTEGSEKSKSFVIAANQRIVYKYLLE